MEDGNERPITESTTVVGQISCEYVIYHVYLNKYNSWHKNAIFTTLTNFPKVLLFNIFMSQIVSVIKVLNGLKESVDSDGPFLLFEHFHTQGRLSNLKTSVLFLLYIPYF